MKRIAVNDKNKAYPYVVYMPEEFTDNLPLIIQLHGSGEKGQGGEDLHLVERHGFANLFKEQDFPCITVMPQCPPDSIWLYEIKELKKFIEDMQNEYKADTDKTCVTGLSMGGYATWFLGISYPEMFAAIAPCCGGGMTAYAKNITMPVWAFHGSDDDVVYPSQSLDMINRIRQLGINPNVKLTIFDGVMHNSWIQAYTEPLMTWMLEQKR